MTTTHEKINAAYKPVVNKANEVHQNAGGYFGSADVAEIIALVLLAIGEELDETLPEYLDHLRPRRGEDAKIGDRVHTSTIDDTGNVSNRGPFTGEVVHIEDDHVLVRRDELWGSPRDEFMARTFIQIPFEKVVFED